MLRAAQFWADARDMGKPTADDAALDCDRILAAQAEDLVLRGDDALVATTNVRHLSLFTRARFWKEI